MDSSKEFSRAILSGLREWISMLFTCEAGRANVGEARLGLDGNTIYKVMPEHVSETIPTYVTKLLVEEVPGNVF